MTEWRSQPLDNHHDTTHFDCGNDTLNQWLRTQAMRAQRAGTARTHVWTNPDSPRVMAYYSVAPTQIAREEIGGTNAGGYSVVPAYLLARLALDRSLQGQRLGTELLLDALEIMMRASVAVGGRVIVVDAIDDNAHAFYRRHDFRPIRDNPNRLFIKVETVHHALGGVYVKVAEDHGTRLVSMVFEAATGRATSIVASVDEVEQVAQRLVKMAEEKAGDPEDTLNFSAVLTDVFGRNPFDEINGEHE